MPFQQSRNHLCLLFPRSRAQPDRARPAVGHRGQDEQHEVERDEHREDRPDDNPSDRSQASQRAGRGIDPPGHPRFGHDPPVDPGSEQEDDRRADDRAERGADGDSRRGDRSGPYGDEQDRGPLPDLERVTGRMVDHVTIWFGARINRPGHGNGRKRTI